MNSIPELLEARRVELCETKAAFARRLFPDLNPDSAETSYGHMSTGARAFPAKHLGVAAEILGMDIKTLSRLPRQKGGLVDTAPTFDPDTLRYLAVVAETLGFPMSSELIERILSERESHSAINGGST